MVHLDWNPAIHVLPGWQPRPHYWPRLTPTRQAASLPLQMIGSLVDRRRVWGWVQQEGGQLQLGSWQGSRTGGGQARVVDRALNLRLQNIPVPAGSQGFAICDDMRSFAGLLRLGEQVTGISRAKEIFMVSDGAG